MRHAVSCLIEAVQPAAAKAVEQEGDSEAAAAAAAAAVAQHELENAQQAQQHCPHGRCMTTRQQQARSAEAAVRGQRPRATLRVTVFGAAGAVARWYQAPAAAFASPTYGGPSGEAAWSSGQGGFTLVFPGPTSAQLELFNGAWGWAAARASPPVPTTSTLVTRPTPTLVSRHRF